MRLKVIISLLLAGITLAIYWPASHFSLFGRDDPLFILSPEVEAGFSPVGINWVIKGVVAANWHPVTTFSFLLMHELYGLNLGAEHLVNVFFHAANAALLFLALVEMTGAMWRSAIVAAIFAWHPLHVESVAWISERKDVLFTFFMLLSMWCYSLYAQAEITGQAARGVAAPTAIARPAKNARAAFLSQNGYYNLALLFFILSLLSKAMVVTLPFLLLLLDYWPLQRLNRSTLRSLIFEKWRFFALAAIFCVITIWTQKSQGAVVSLETVGAFTRLENAILSYVSYLGKFFWPEKLAAIYPLPQSFDIVQVLLAVLLLLAISAFCILQISRRPYLAVGWFWYLITLVPVIGLVQLGAQAMADRYTYITLIGPTVSLVWLVWEWARNSLVWRYGAMGTTTVILAVCVVLTERQLQFWKDTVTEIEHTIAVTSNNGLTDYVLALGFEHEGLNRQAAVHYLMTITEHPDNNHFMANFYLAVLRENAGFYKDATVHLEAALQINPNSADALNRLAWILATCPDATVRNGARAVKLAERACELSQEQNPLYLTTLAAAYAEAGRFDDAVSTTQKAIALANQYGMDQLSEGDQEVLQTYSAHQTYAQTHPATVQSQ